MQLDNVSPALQERLGLDGTVGLLGLLASARQEWSAAVTSLSIERFERRLTEEVSGLRVTIAESNATLRAEIKSESAELRSEIRQGLGALRSEIKQDLSTLRSEVKQDLSALRSEVKQDLSALRSDFTHEMSSLRVGTHKLHASTLRWMLAFWVGQTAAIAGIIAAMFQIYTL